KSGRRRPNHGGAPDPRCWQRWKPPVSAAAPSFMRHFRLPPLWLLLALPFGLRANVTLPSLFSDHAVLQRGKPVPIWGRAEAGEHVAVTFHGQTVGATAGSDGHWIVFLSALDASADPADLVVAGKNTLTLHDVLVGEVWLCSGQSNMEFVVRSATNPTFRVNDADAEVAAANYPLIRHFKVERLEADAPAEAVSGTWAVCSPQTVTDFTAVGYFFARDLQEKLHVPIGLINSTWGGTPIE